MKFSLGQIARMIGAPVPAEKKLQDAVVQGFSIDTRSLQPGDLFFAVRGEKRDGHDFIADAFSKGAVAAVGSRAPAAHAERLLVTPDATAALQRLAAAARERWGKQIVAVTGSNGKTTTKEIIAALLGTRFSVAKSEGNLNNELGLPLSLLRMPEEAEVGVFELGMNHAGEIRSLAAIARPDVGVVTNVNPVHLEFFDSVDAIALAKRELIEGLPATGTAILNADDERVRAFAKIHRGRVVTFGIDSEADVRAVDLEGLGLYGNRFRLRGVGERFTAPLPGRHNVYNTLAGLATASVFGIAPESLSETVRSLSPVHMRGELLECGEIRIINDCYNSNPRAAEMMLALLGATLARRRIAVLGEMLELGPAAEELHRQVGRKAAWAGIDLLAGVQGAAKQLVEEAVFEGLPTTAAHFFDDAREAGEFLKAELRPGDTVLFKASRGVKLEQALNIAISAQPSTVSNPRPAEAVVADG